MNLKPAVETPVILMSQNREMFLLDHNPASVNTPTMSRTMNLLWAQISISRFIIDRSSFDHLSSAYLDQVDTVRRFPGLIRSVVRVQRVIPIQNLPLRRLSLRLRLRWWAADIFDAQSTLCVLKIPKMFRR